ncbi:hypothetical protein [Halobacillus sp. Nhm2S1]|uniref:hypothetical protein n=1 Tax=Halobacillus sp. Nhm2S1 TaxID=2866716 RepID=UPI001C72B543|nr:hypothetical protein [Halobacillus sp. Nhm2S1]MBX0358440.1 hypothetical protein [Halobacillus sp. Nhm2S1]
MNRQGYVVSVIGRSLTKQEDLKAKTSTPERIHNLRVDYKEQYLLEAEPANCSKRSIYLGFVIEGDESRRLTNEEISGGVIRSIDADTEESISGVFHPYEAQSKQ